jgi:hypothetical protein
MPEATFLPPHSLTSSDGGLARWSAFVPGGMNTKKANVVTDGERPPLKPNVSFRSRLHG